MRKVWNYIRTHRWLGIVLGVLLVGAVLFLVLGNRNKSSLADMYETVTVENGALTASIGATGTVRANQSAVLNWQTGGTVEKVNFQLGDKVQAGDVLASLARASMPQSIILAEAELASAEKDLEDLMSSDTAQAQAAIALRQSQDAYDDARENREAMNGPVKYEAVQVVTKMTPLGPVKIPRMRTFKYDPDPEDIRKADETLALATAQLEDAQRTYDRLKEGPNARDVAAAEARVAAAQATINMGSLIAPSSGTITEGSLLPGDQVQAGAFGFRVDDLSTVLVDVQVSEVDINNVQVGQPAKLSFDAILDSNYHGRVSKVSQAGSVVQGVVNFDVTVEITDADEYVRPGMTAAVTITVDEYQNVLLVPNRSVRLVNNKRIVYAIVDEQIEMIEIELGASSDTDSVVAGGKLQAGEVILLNPPAEFQGPGGPPAFVRNRE